MHVLIFLAGVFVGVIVGVFTAGLMNCARDPKVIVKYIRANDDLPEGACEDASSYVSKDVH